jgi:hypothetical protein
MASKNGNGMKATAANERAVGGAAGVQGSEADFNDTIARNRGLPLVDPATVPRAPAGFRSTDPVERMRRIRWLSSDLRAEAEAALSEGGKRDLRAELGQFAPDPQRATMLADRVSRTGDMVALVEALLAYAKEVDQIAMSDALMFLEAERKQYLNAVEHNEGLATSYRALVSLFEMRSGAIAEGIARAKTGDAAAPAVADGAVKGPGK